MSLDDIYARDLRRHRLIGRLLSMGGVAAEWCVMTAVGTAVLAVVLGGMI